MPNVTSVSLLKGAIFSLVVRCLPRCRRRWWHHFFIIYCCRRWHRAPLLFYFGRMNATNNNEEELYPLSSPPLPPMPQPLMMSLCHFFIRRRRWQLFALFYLIAAGRMPNATSVSLFNFFLPNGRDRRQWKGAILLPCRPMPHTLPPPLMTLFLFLFICCCQC